MKYTNKDMMDHKFTDDQIIFSLVCHEDWNEMCEQCPYTLSKACGSQLARNAIDLIKRQQAEIERLKKYAPDVNGTLESEKLLKP